jgi:hypothetical protein
LPFDKNDEISQIFSESQAAAREIESLEQWWAKKLEGKPKT